VRQVPEALPGGIPARCLPAMLADRGYATGFFQSATEGFEKRRALVANMGYRDFVPLESMDATGFERVNYFGYEDDLMLEPSRRWLLLHRGGPTFATYLTVTTHHPYDAPDRYGSLPLAADDSLNGYLNGVRYLDRFLSKLFEQYHDLGLIERTIFVIVGDHGEGFGEHARWGHDTVIYEEGIRVPLLIHDPRRVVPGGERIDGIRSHLDVLPTVVDLLGFQLAEATYEGRSLLESVSSDRELRVSCWSPDACVALISGNFKAIHHFGARPDELFDLAVDPTESADLAARLPRRVARMVRGSRAWAESLRMQYRRYQEERARVSGQQSVAAPI
jgi:arylsulfatase A-like enzyme